MKTTKNLFYACVAALLLATFTAPAFSQDADAETAVPPVAEVAETASENAKIREEISLEFTGSRPNAVNVPEDPAERAERLEAVKAELAEAVESLKTLEIPAAPPAAEESPAVKTDFLFTLPEICPTAADLSCAPWDDVIVACPNSTDRNHPPVLMRVSPEGKYYLWSVSPIDPVTGTANPVFILFGEDGNLYICDNQSADPEKASGRIIRLLVNEQRRAYSAEVVAFGIKNPIGLAIRQDTIYVLNRLTTDAETGAATTVVHYFPLDGTIIEVKNTPDEPTAMAAFVSTEERIYPAFDRLVAATVGEEEAGVLYLADSRDGKLFTLPALDAERDATKEPLEPSPLAVTVSAISAMTTDEAGNVYLLDAKLMVLGVLEPGGNYRVLVSDVLPLAESNARAQYALCVREKALLLLVSPQDGLPTVSRIPLE